MIERLLVLLMQSLRLSILKKALELVPEKGFTLNAIEFALNDMQISTGFNGSVQPVDLIAFSQKQMLSDVKDSENGDFYSKVDKKFTTRNNSMKLYAKHWVNATAELTKHPELAAKILQEQCHSILYNSGDKSHDVNWYIRYGLMSQMIVASDLYLTQDQTANFHANDKFVRDLVCSFRDMDKSSHKIGIKLQMVMASLSKKF